MKPNQPHQKDKTGLHEKTPMEFLPPCSLKETSDPLPFNDNENKMNNVGNKGGDELDHVSVVDTVAADEKQAKIITKMEDVENLNAVKSQSWTIIESSSENGAPQIKKAFHKEKFKADRNVETLYQDSRNNNCMEETFLSQSKAAYADKLMYGSQSTSWKRERVGYGDSEDFPLPSPWKRVAYVAMLFVVGISCAILAVMKVFGGADWMNTATFSVIIMGGLLLLPPGLYYGHIVICVTCQCKGYSFWDVPQGPFG